MYRDDGSGPSCRRGPDGFRCKVLAVWIDIGEDRFRAAHDHATRGGNKGSARHDHFVAWADPEGVKREFQSDGAVSHRDAILAARLCRKLLLEPPAFFAGPIVDLAGAEHPSCGFDFVRLKLRPRSERSGPHRSPTIHCQI